MEIQLALMDIATAVKLLAWFTFIGLASISIAIWTGR